ncbi:MAG TPA: hypothetical protein VGG29_05960 [Caulobacteraceae bacterium]|jgi:hypothetical protein
MTGRWMSGRWLSGRWLAALCLGLALSLAGAGAALADTTVSFYSHGWGVGTNGFLYFPHAFVVIRRTSPDGAAKQEAYGYTAASTTDITVLMHPSRGVVEEPNGTYRKHATLHFTVTLTDAQYQALEARVAWWGAATSPLYNLDGHNCISFVADLASSIGLQVPDAGGRDPARFLEGVKRLNGERLMAAAGAPVTAPAQ